MEFADIEKLAKLMKSTGLTSVEWTREGESLKLSMEGPPPARPYAAPAPAAPETAAELAPPAPVVQGMELKAPMVGMLYLAPAPDAKPFVSVGDRVKQGDVVCIIEAMKLMNEITAEQDGEIVEILVSNGQVVEFGQPLFRLR